MLAVSPIHPRGPDGGNEHVEAMGLLEEQTFAKDEALQESFRERLIKGMVTGVGFLSDAYDLFIINGVMLIIQEYDPSVKEYKSGIATAVLVGAIIGQLSFGIVADQIGRRLGFILTLALVISGSIASSLSFNLGRMNVYVCLMVFRFLLGVGVGGEYPLSATISAETSSTQKRGKNTALVFSMQGVGSLLATIVGFSFYMAFPHRLELVWRLSLAFGAVPGILLFYFRVRMHETPRFAASALQKPQPKPVPTPGSPQPLSYHTAPVQQTEPLASSSSSSFDDLAAGVGTKIRRAFRKLWNNYQVRVVRANWRRLAGTAGCWFLLDVTFYANGLFSTTVLRVAGVKEDLQSVLTWNIYLALGALPGYWVAVFLIEILGRKKLQMGGFALLGTLYLSMGLAGDKVESSGSLFFFLYALTFFITNAGPNTTTYVLPSESFPTEVRATCHGISAACGKAGAAVGAALMQPLLDTYGLPTVLIICACVAFAGAVHTFIFTIETLGKSLEQINSANPHIKKAVQV